MLVALVHGRECFLSFSFGCVEVAPGILVRQPGIEPKAPEPEGPLVVEFRRQRPRVLVSVLPLISCATLKKFLYQCVLVSLACHLGAIISVMWHRSQNSMR